MQKKSVKMKKKFTASDLLVGAIFVLLFLYCASLLLPVFWMVWSSFKDVFEFTLYPFDLPELWFPQNYPDVLEMLKITRIKDGAYYTYGVVEMTGYSILISAVLPLPGVIWPLAAGYIVSKYEFRGKKLFMAINLFVMTVPFIGTLPAALRLSKALGRYDNLLLQVVLSGSPFGFGFLLYYGAFKGISKTYSEDRNSVV